METGFTLDHLTGYFSCRNQWNNKGEYYNESWIVAWDNRDLARPEPNHGEHVKDILQLAKNK